jgi:hypothetical protein
MTEVRCCCSPENLIGYVPEEAGREAGLELRELDDGTFAFDSNHDADAVREIPGFTEAAHKPGTKTWKKTWRKK